MDVNNWEPLRNPSNSRVGTYAASISTVIPSILIVLYKKLHILSPNQHLTLKMWHRNMFEAYTIFRRQCCHKQLFTHFHLSELRKYELIYLSKDNINVNIALTFLSFNWFSECSMPPHILSSWEENMQNI